VKPVHGAPRDSAAMGGWWWGKVGWWWGGKVERWGGRVGFTKHDRNVLVCPPVRMPTSEKCVSQFFVPSEGT